MLSTAARGHAPSQLRHLLCSRIFSTSTSSGISGKSEPVRSEPPPIRITQTSSAGRGVFATRAITTGETIHSAKPLVTHPSISRFHEVCYYCLRRKKGDDGVDIGWYYFCSDSCREKSMAFYEVESRGDWSMLNEYCRDRGLKYPLMMKRLACMVICGAVSSDCLDILQPTYMHKEMLLAMEDEYKLLKKSLKEANIADEMMAYPNAHIVWVDSSDAKMKALRDIEEGEELRICYIDASMDVKARQSILLEGFGFHCNCLRCLSGE